MTETLLFLHVLTAFFLVAAVVIYSAFVLGSPVNRPTRTIAEILWGIGGLGTLVLGIWLALDIDGYGLLDGWIIAAIVLWLLATGAGTPVSRGIQPRGDDSALALPSNVIGAHWVRTAIVVALLVVMIYKPGA
ncbi:MAG TPA: hypothetical protein VK920_09530 [Solirubrobacterales bacterium]|nr:hypothetical protein [Solirubrobacterales bacterium]